MPPLPHVTGVIRVSLVGIYGATGEAVTRFFIRYSGTTPTQAQINTFAAAVGTAWGTNLKPLHGGQYELLHVEAADLSSATAPIGLATVNIGGTRTGSPLSAGTALVAAYQIARRYRGGHPRGYWAFGVSADLTGSQQWSDTFVSACNTGLSAFFTALNADGWTGAGTLDHVNVSYFSGFHVVTDPITGRARNVPTLRGTPLVDTVTNIVARSAPGSQRRRN